MLNPNFDLQGAMQQLESTLQYFVSVPARENVDFEESYHATTTDPDGNIRNLLEERQPGLAAVSEILDYLNKSKPGKILDFGCGLGWILSALDDDWNRFGLEISKFAAGHARQFGKIFNGNFMEYGESGFDYIVMNHVIEHLTNPLEAIVKIESMLKPDGILILGTPNFDSAAARRYRHNYRMLHDPTHITLFSEDSIRRLLRDNGFVIEKVEYPFFNTTWFNKEDLLRMLDSDGVSPPFYGSFITVFARKK